MTASSTRPKRATREADTWTSPSLRDAFWQGYDSSANGVLIDDCPFNTTASEGANTSFVTAHRHAWMHGWETAKKLDTRKPR